MPGFDLPTKAQLLESCNAIEGVLDALRDYTDFTLTNRSRIFPPVKALFTSLQSLEDDAGKARGAFHTAEVRTRHNLAGVLTGCCVVAGRLRQRINSNALRHDDDFDIELMALTAEIEGFLKLRNRNPASTVRSKAGTGSDSSAVVEDLLRKQQSDQSEMESLEAELRAVYSRQQTFKQDIEALNAELTTKDKLISRLENNNSAKLSHIRRLHASISNLGLRHPMKHQTYDWDDLADELPHMVQKIENINLKLKELELERDEYKDQEHESDDDMVASAPKPPSATNGSKATTMEKDAKKKKGHRKSADAKASSKVRSPSPTSSEASKAISSKSVRRRSRNNNTGSSSFFGH